MPAALPMTPRPAAIPPRRRNNLMAGAAPYQAMAPFYDRIMAHVDYDAWARHVRTLWHRFGGATPPRRVLELAAGTCPFAAPPLFPGAFLLHSDCSPAMLRAAAAPARRAAFDARALAVRGPFDLLLMLYDSLNYLLRGEEVLRTLRQAKAVLRPGGLFVFDVTTAQCSRRHFADGVDAEELAGGAYVRRSRYLEKTRLQINAFTFFLNDAGGGGSTVTREELHQQRIYPASALRRWAERAGFRVRACLAGFGFRPGTDRSERLHFVLERP